MRVANFRPRPRPGLIPAVLLVLLTATLVASARPAAAATTAATASPRPPKVVATGPSHLARRPSAALANATTQLVDHGGRIIADIHLYAIWWGRSAAFPADAKSAVTDFLDGLDGSRHLALLAPYLRGAMPHTSSVVSFTDPANPPRSATAVSIGAEVAKVTNGTVDPAGVYLVFTSNAPSGATYCGWHNSVVIAGVRTPVVYLPLFGNGSPCDAGDRVGANNLSERTRALVNVAAHELFEVMTDAEPGPGTAAWVDSSGAEIGDKCAWQFVAPVRLRNGTRWQVQTEWANASRRCEQGA